MAEVEPFVFRWGIISTGRIASCFVQDILLDPTTRGVYDVIHEVVAVGSRSVEKAQEFIVKYADGDNSIKAYGTYEEVYANKNVDAVYIGTPHTYHYENAMAAIKAGKHVLVEKPCTSNTAELKALIQAARENNVFIMEAMWTRFLPITQEVKKFVEEGKLGRPVVMHADLSGDFDIGNLPLTHRILDPQLGGGALLDLGPYPFVWAMIAFAEYPPHSKMHYDINNVIVSGSMLKTPLTNVDANTTFTLVFPSPEPTSSVSAAQAVLSCSINAFAAGFGCHIRYERGAISIAPPIYCPKKFTVEYFNLEPDSATKIKSKEKGERKIKTIMRVEHLGGGWHFQADEVARCVREGKLESEQWSHAKMILEMEVFDEVRKQGGYALPPGVERVV